MKNEFGVIIKLYTLELSNRIELALFASNQLLSVTIHRELENGSQIKASAVEVRSVKTDSYTNHPMQSKGSSVRIPEWKTRFFCANRKTVILHHEDMNNCKMKHLFKIVTNQTSDSMKCTGDCQPYPSKPRNFPLENYALKLLIHQLVGHHNPNSLMRLRCMLRSFLEATCRQV